MILGVVKHLLHHIHSSYLPIYLAQVVINILVVTESLYERESVGIFI